MGDVILGVVLGFFVTSSDPEPQPKKNFCLFYKQKLGKIRIFRAREWGSSVCG